MPTHINIIDHRGRRRTTWMWLCGLAGFV